MHESAGYPESSAKFSDELQSKLLNLPEKDLEKCGNKVLERKSREKDAVNTKVGH